MNPASKLMKQAVADGVFPGGVLLVARYDKILFHEAFGKMGDESDAAVCRSTIYDLASLTKPLATAAAIMHLVQQNKLSVEQRLAGIIRAFEQTDKADIQIRHLLCHNAGLPDYRPYYSDLLKKPEADRKLVLRRHLVAEPLLHPIAARTVYSDLGFMVLEWVIEAVSGQTLDAYIQRSVYRPLGIESLFFLPSGSINIDHRRIAPTERRADGRLIRGRVHDENAEAVGGVCGHAGLFGTAEAVYRLLFELLAGFSGASGRRLLESSVVQQFLSIPEAAERAMGFDVPAPKGSSCGRHFTPGRTVGHLGFTGTSFWVDLSRGIVVILLSNRVCPSRENEKIKIFRPKLHNAVMKKLNS